MLSNGTAGLSKEVQEVREGALELQMGIEEDEEAIATVVTTANRTLLVSGAVDERVRMANVSGSTYILGCGCKMLCNKGPIYVHMYMYVHNLCK